METDKHQEPLTFSEKCRLCLCSAGIVDLFESICLVEDIFLCTGITIYNSENLPKKICLKCCEIIANAKELRQLVSANEALLNSLFDDRDKTDRSPEHKQTHEKHEFHSPPHKSKTKTQTLETEVESPSEDRSTNKRRKTELINTPHGKRTKSQDSSKTMKSPRSETNSECKNRKTINVRKDLFKVSDNTLKPVIKEECKAKLRLLGVNIAEHSCEVCSKVFDTSKKLYLHQRLHNKTIVCPLDMCGKTFSTKGDLEKHKRTHTGEKPFQCDICEKSFTQRATLKAHRENVHHTFVYN